MLGSATHRHTALIKLGGRKRGIGAGGVNSLLIFSINLAVRLGPTQECFLFFFSGKTSRRILEILLRMFESLRWW